MNADAFRHLYDYHFRANRRLWDQCIVPLSQAQFIQKIPYSIGSIRNQVVHLWNIDDRWFSGLLGRPIPGFFNPVHLHKREIIRAKWDALEADMRVYLDKLRDDMLLDQPFMPIDSDPIRLWQVLIHVVNHGTDHRAQLLAMLHQIGSPTFPQDYADFVDGSL